MSPDHQAVAARRWRYLCSWPCCSTGHRRRDEHQTCCGRWRNRGGCGIPPDPAPGTGRQRDPAREGAGARRPPDRPQQWGRARRSVLRAGFGQGVALPEGRPVARGLLRRARDPSDRVRQGSRGAGRGRALPPGRDRTQGPGQRRARGAHHRPGRAPRARAARARHRGSALPLDVDRRLRRGHARAGQGRHRGGRPGAARPRAGGHAPFGRARRADDADVPRGSSSRPSTRSCAAQGCRATASGRWPATTPIP